ncbi:MAG: AI-2E family transporter, partial [Chloroflexota bacterium]
VLLTHLRRFTQAIRNYLVLKTWISLGTGLCVTIWLMILGIDFPILWGLLAFLLNYISNIGSVIAALPVVLLGAVQSGLVGALLVAFGYIVINTIIGNLIEPRLMGRGLQLSPLVIFLSLLFWGWVLGTVGALLSVPLTMAVKIALESSEDTRWLASLLDEETGGNGVEIPT